MARRIAIFYGSGEGQTEKIAGYIARHLGGLDFQVDSFDAKKLPAQFDADIYDGLMVGASVHAGGYPKAIARLVREHRSALESKPSAFFSVSLTASDKSESAQQEIQEIIDNFLGDLQWQPLVVGSFAGAIPFGRYGFFKRMAMKAILRARGEVVDSSKDYEYTDWNAVDEFADEFARLVEETVDYDVRPRT